MVVGWAAVKQEVHVADAAISMEGKKFKHGALVDLPLRTVKGKTSGLVLNKLFCWAEKTT